MDNSSESSGLDPSGLAVAVLHASSRLFQNLMMITENASSASTTTETTSTHLKPLHLAVRPQGGPENIHDLPCFRDLIAVLVECFTIISLGYLSSRFKLISTDAKDLSAYLTTFALPMVIFLNIAQMEFQTINMSFLFCMLISKLLLFIIVTLITLAISYPANFSFAGALSILATQSNDFALGYPLIKSLYGESRPEMLSYLNLMGPIQLLIINPLGIIMLEYGKSKSVKQEQKASGRHSSNGSTGRSRKENVHCSFCSFRQPPGLLREQLAGRVQSEQQIIKTEHHRPQSISNQSSSLAKSNAQCMRSAKLAPSSQLQRISSSLINLSDNKENVSGQHSIAVDVDRKYIRSPSANSERTQDDNQLETGVRPRSIPFGSIKRKNIKSLTLVMPASSLPIHQMSSDSASSSASDLSGGDAPIPNECHFSAGPHVKLTSAQQVTVGSLRNSSKSLNIARSATSGNNPQIAYTRPKLFNLSPVSTWRPLTGAKSTSNRHRQQARGFADDDTQMRSVLTGDPDPTTSYNYCCHSDAPQADESKIDLSFIRALLTNPLIIASIVALAVNLIHGPELPKFVTKVSNTIAASFAAPALFVVGLSMYGKFNLMVRNPNDFLLSCVLVLTKVLILPSIMRTVVMLIIPHYSKVQDVPNLADFSYLYGLLPTAPGACIIAKQYEVLTNVVSICMLLSTLISAPLVLATSAVISQAASIKPFEVVSMTVNTLRASSSITLILSLFILYLLWKSNRRITYLNSIDSIERIIETANGVKATHLFTFLLTITQLVIGIGGTTWFFVDISRLKLNHGVEYPIITATGPPEWIDDGELQASEESRSLHNPFMRLASQGIPAAQQEHTEDEQNDLVNFGAMCTMQYVFSSGGFLMARFIILCIVLTNFAHRFGNQRFGQLICSLIMKLFPLVGIAIILNLVFEAQHLSCLPNEPSLPSWTISIYTRLLFDGTLLICALPLFTTTFRLENMAAWSKKQDPAQLSLRDQKRFKHSSVSLTSDTSSAITTSTNLDTSINRHAPNSRRNSTARRPSSADKQKQTASDPPNNALDLKALEQSYHVNGHVREQQVEQRQARLASDETHVQNLNQSEEHESDEISSLDRRQNTQIDVETLCDLYHPNNPGTSNSLHHQVKSDESQIDDPQQAIKTLDSSFYNPVSIKLIDDDQSLDLDRDNGVTKSQTTATDKMVTNDQTRLKTSHSILMDEQPQQAGWSSARLPPSCNWDEDFDKYSILVVFMLFQAFLNLTSMIQQLNQSSSMGTFTLIEIVNVALDFGQGLVTFLVICLQMSPIKILSSSAADDTIYTCSRRESPVRPIV